MDRTPNGNLPRRLQDLKLDEAADIVSALRLAEGMLELDENKAYQTRQLIAKLKKLLDKKNAERKEKL